MARRSRRRVHIGKYNIGPYIAQWLLESRVLGYCPFQLDDERPRGMCPQLEAAGCAYVTGKYRYTRSDVGRCGESFIYRYIVRPDRKRG